MKLALTPIVEQLRRAGLRQVEGLLELSTKTAEPRQLPAFFVVPTGEDARANTADSARDQAVDVSFAVIVVVDGARRNQAGISEELKVQSDAVRDALTGWTHPEASRPCAYAGGRLASGNGSTAEWAVRFSARYHIRKVS